MKKVNWLLVLSMLSVLLFAAPSAYAFGPPVCDNNFSKAGAPAAQTAAASKASPAALTGNVTPQVFCSGDFGYARLDYVYGGGGFAWSASPDSGSIYRFSGSITVINNTSGSVAAVIPISGWGTGSGSASGLADFNAVRGQSYTATLSGRAYDASGYVTSVAENCSIQVFRP
ncbi:MULTISPECIES: hypothetical protein [Paenibacillus]|uniref:hypothetical protein n=1 Tax=Paenibacillus TaxID=44249 RepID=UPI0022B8D8AA|nr:hypothetical protein [Paenibacillus caseinilyticus]MCZ8520849.1 hypothetical protein [Paenibacillus caseinilyticus]